MKITCWSDFACPYCYIGNTRLKKAIKDLNLENEVEFDIRAFELDPNAPKNVESKTVERFSVKYGLSLTNNSLASLYWSDWFIKSLASKP